MKNEKFKNAYDKIKSFLASSLTAENTDEITKLSNDLDAMQEAMEKEEQDHLATKDKLVDYVKSTSFSKQPSKDIPEDDSPKSMEEAEEIALKQLLDNRKNNKGN